MNVIELIGLIIADTEELLADFSQSEQRNPRQLIEHILNASQFIQTELKHFAADDGIIYEVDRSKGSYARAPFAMVETAAYLLKKLHQLGSITLSVDELEQIAQIEYNIKLIRNELDSFWSDNIRNT